MIMIHLAMLVYFFWSSGLEISFYFQKQNIVTLIVST